MKDLFSIGEMAKLFNINIKTLRYYDEIDLFKPIFIDRANNYRYYSTDQFEQLNTILYLKAVGMPLSKIDSHLSKRNIDNITNLLEEQKEVTKNKIKELKKIEKKIDNTLKQINYARQYDKLDIIQEIEFDERRIVLLKQKIRTNDDLELSIRDLENKTQKNGLAFNGKVGVSISKEHLEQGKFEQYDSMFIFAEGEKYKKKFIKVLPKGNYITVRFNGDHKMSPKYYKDILGYIDKKGYKIADDSVEVTLIDYGLTTEKTDFVTEIQILVN